jgi:ribonuclease HI
MKHSSEIPYSLDTHLNEQHSLLSLLTYLHENGYQDVLIHTDDLNLFNEIQNKYVRKMKYKEYLNETLGYLETLQNVDVKWVKRNYNQEADKLCKLAYK